MKLVITGAKYAPYEMTDDRTGRTQKGHSGKVWGFKTRPNIAEGAAGFESFEFKCDPPSLAESLVAELVKSGGAPLVCEAQSDVKGSGKFVKVVLTDAEVEGIFGRDFLISHDGIKRRERAAAGSQAAPAPKLATA